VKGQSYGSRMYLPRSDGYRTNIIILYLVVNSVGILRMDVVVELALLIVRNISHRIFQRGDTLLIVVLVNCLLNYLIAKYLPFLQSAWESWVGELIRWCRCFVPDFVDDSNSNGSFSMFEVGWESWAWSSRHVPP